MTVTGANSAEHLEIYKLLGMRQRAIETRIKNEKMHADLIREITDTAIKRIKKLARADKESPHFITLPLIRLMEEFGIDPKERALKAKVLYYLRAYKEFITKKGEPEKGYLTEQMTPIAYSYVGEEQRKAMGVDAHYMKNLNKGAKQYIYDRAQKVGAKSELFDLLYVCDYLVGHEAHNKWIKSIPMKLSLDLGQPILLTKQALEDLVKMKVLLTAEVKREKRGIDVIYHLAGSLQEYSTLNNQLQNEEPQTNYRNETKVLVKEAFISKTAEVISKNIPQEKGIEIADKIKQGKGLGLLNQKVLTKITDGSKLTSISESQELNKGISEKDAECLEYIRSLMIQAQADQTKEGEKDQKIKKLQRLLSLSQKENTDLRAELAKAESETNKLMHKLKILEDFNNAYANEARKAMNQLISSVSTITERYTQIPCKRVTPDDTAEFKNGIISAATESQNRLRDFTYSQSVETLKR